jgi:hypothetical protein
MSPSCHQAQHEHIEGEGTIEDGRHITVNSIKFRERNPGSELDLLNEHKLGDIFVTEQGKIRSSE